MAPYPAQTQLPFLQPQQQYHQILPSGLLSQFGPATMASCYTTGSQNL
jgi:hypothetical protein